MSEIRQKLLGLKFLDRERIVSMLIDPTITNEDKLEIKKFDEECLSYFGEEWEESQMSLINDFYFEEYAEDLFFDTYEVPEDIAGYIDLDKFARDLRYDYTIISLFAIDFYGMQQYNIINIQTKKEKI